METDVLCVRLETSAQELYYISETDSPFKITIWKNANVPVDRFPSLINASESTDIEMTTLHHFFRNHAFEMDWHDESQKQHVARFRSFMNLIENNLKDIQVYRFGKISIDNYIVGRNQQDLIAIHTKSVET
jgi:hypothetical protein